MNRKLLLIIGLLLVLAAAAAYVVVSRDDSSTNQTATNTEESAGDETADAWETYRNEDLGFEIKYPSGWQIEASREDGRLELWSYQEPAEEGEEPVKDEDKIRVVVQHYDNDSNLSASEWAELNADPAAEVVEDEEFAGEGFTAYKQQLRRTDTGETFYRVTVPRDGQMYLVTWLNASDHLLDEIMRTVRFTE